MLAAGFVLLAALAGALYLKRPTPTADALASNVSASVRDGGSSPETSYLPPAQGSSQDASNIEQVGDESLAAAAYADTTKSADEASPAAAPGLGSEPAPSPIGASSDSLAMNDGQIYLQTDDNGNTYGLGQVTIVNNGDGDITDFRLSVDTGNGTVQLIPFDGSLDNPMSITDRRIPPGGRLVVPVMTAGNSFDYDPSQPLIMRLQATQDGNSNILTNYLPMDGG